MEESYYTKFINFFDNHNLYDKKIFDYIRERCIFFHYFESEYRNYIRVYYFLDKNEKLIDFKLIVPFIESEESLFINIHEYVHAIYAYSRLRKKFILDDTCEINSLFFEKVYLLENNVQELIDYSIKLNDIRIKSNEDKYVLGLKAADELMKTYNNEINLEKLSKKSKKLVRKYKYQKKLLTYNNIGGF